MLEHLGENSISSRLIHEPISLHDDTKWILGPGLLLLDDNGSLVIDDYYSISSSAEICSYATVDWSPKYRCVPSRVGKRRLVLLQTTCKTTFSLTHVLRQELECSESLCADASPCA